MSHAATARPSWPNRSHDRYARIGLALNRALRGTDASLRSVRFLKALFCLIVLFCLPRPRAFADQPTITVTEKDQNRAYTVKPGATIDVQLADVAGDGLSWHLVQRVDPRISVTEETPKAAGAGDPGQQVFHIVARSPARLPLIFHYSRADAKIATPAKKFRIKLVIKP